MPSQYNKKGQLAYNKIMSRSASSQSRFSGRHRRNVHRINAVKAIDKQQDKDLMKLKRDVFNLKKDNELKHATTELSFGGIVVGTSAQNTMNNPAQAITDVARIGDALTNVFCNINLTAQGLATDETILRIIVFWDKQNVITNQADLLEGAGTANQNINSPVDWDKKKQFQILRDRTFILLPGNVVGTTNTNFQAMRQIKFRINLKNKVTRFESAGTTVLNNALKIMLMSSNTVAIDVDGFAQVGFRG